MKISGEQNGIIERFFRSLKEECAWQFTFGSFLEAKKAIARWIEWYNGGKTASIFRLQESQGISGSGTGVGGCLKNGEHHNTSPLGCQPAPGCARSGLPCTVRQLRRRRAYSKVSSTVSRTTSLNSRFTRASSICMIFFCGSSWSMASSWFVVMRQLN